MKRLKNVWSKICDESLLRDAILNASKGKMKYRKVRRKVKRVDIYAKKLSDMLASGKFTPSPYKVDKIKTEYGKEREIFKLPFYPDRCVQHGISIVMRPRWDKSLTADTYACLIGRGINCKEARYNLNKKVKKAIGEYKHGPLYCLKMDIK